MTIAVQITSKAIHIFAALALCVLHTNFSDAYRSFPAIPFPILDPVGDALLHVTTVRPNLHWTHLSISHDHQGFDGGL